MLKMRAFWIILACVPMAASFQMNTGFNHSRELTDGLRFTKVSPTVIQHYWGYTIDNILGAISGTPNATDDWNPPTQISTDAEGYYMGVLSIPIILSIVLGILVAGLVTFCLMRSCLKKFNPEPPIGGYKLWEIYVPLVFLFA
eukprot:394540_1